MVSWHTRWSNPSVLALARGADPVETVRAGARDIVTRAIDGGWSGPPFEPLELAGILKLEVVARDDVRDARTVPLEGRKLRIEYNPSRPRGRVRYSLAHEIAHTIFSDCWQRVRHRLEHQDLAGNEWQLEALCNIAAAELVMPLGSLPALTERNLNMDHLIELREKFEVSTEALFIRVVEVTDEPCAMFCASRTDRAPGEGHYRLDYVIGSRSWAAQIPKGALAPPTALLNECTAIGYTAKGEDRLGNVRLNVECIGLPPYPGGFHPRVAGLLKPRAVRSAEADGITYLKGNAAEPRGAGAKLVVQVINDATPNWGGKGFAQVVRHKWPVAQDHFRQWTLEDRDRLMLGRVAVVGAEADIQVASIVAQKGYGPSAKPRIRYAALAEGLRQVAEVALRDGASVHMPRIGCGQAGGSWEIVHELIEEYLCRRRIRVFVYDLPSARAPVGEEQRTLTFTA